MISNQRETAGVWTEYNKAPPPSTPPSTEKLGAQKNKFFIFKCINLAHVADCSVKLI